MRPVAVVTIDIGRERVVELAVVDDEDPILQLASWVAIRRSAIALAGEPGSVCRRC